MQPFDDVDINTFFTTSLAIPTRTIYVGSVDPTGGKNSGEEDPEPGTDFRMAERVIKAIHILDSFNNEPITIIMNNVGGDEYHGLGIFDAIKTAKSYTTIRVFGQAMSMGSIILQAANRRLLAPNATIMVHLGDTRLVIPTREMPQYAKETQRLNDLVDQIFLERIREKNARYSLERVKELQIVDRYLNAKESVEIGLADGVIE